MKKIIAFQIALILLLTCSTNAIAATGITGVYLGPGNVYYANGALDYEVRGYIFYFSNTTSYLELSSMVQWVFNYGEYEINEVYFEACDGEFINHASSWGTINGVVRGGNARIEADWDSICATQGKSHIYMKNNTDVYAYTDMSSGNNYGGLGGWESFLFSTSRYDNFHY